MITSTPANSVPYYLINNHIFTFINLILFIYFKMKREPNKNRIAEVELRDN